jgi:G3E family GTPase
MHRICAAVSETARLAHWIKGTLNVADAATPVAVHAVQHLVHTPRHLEAWPDADRRSRLVFIARGLDPAVIERSFRVFSVPQR